MKHILILFALVLSSLTAWGQEDLKTGSLLGKSSPFMGRKDVTTIYMSGQSLKSYRLSLYSSLSIQTPSEEDTKLVEQALAADLDKAAEKQIVRRGSRIFYLFMQFPDRNGLHRYVIYRNKSAATGTERQMRLIYMEGKATRKDLQEMF